MKKIWLKKFGSFEEAEKSDREYYAKMTPSERINLMQFLREAYCKKNNIRPRLVKTINIIKF